MVRELKRKLLTELGSVCRDARRETCVAYRARLVIRGVGQKNGPRRKTKKEAYEDLRMIRSAGKSGRMFQVMRRLVIENNKNKSSNAKFLIVNAKQNAGYNISAYKPMPRGNRGSRPGTPRTVIHTVMKDSRRKGCKPKGRTLRKPKGCKPKGRKPKGRKPKDATATRMPSEVPHEVKAAKISSAPRKHFRLRASPRTKDNLKLKLEDRAAMRDAVHTTAANIPNEAIGENQVDDASPARPKRFRCNPSPATQEKVPAKRVASKEKAAAVKVVGEEKAPAVRVVGEETPYTEWSNRGRWAVAWSPQRGVFSFKRSAGENMDQAGKKHGPEDEELGEVAIEYF